MAIGLALLLNPGIIFLTEEMFHNWPLLLALTGLAKILISPGPQGSQWSLLLVFLAGALLPVELGYAGGGPWMFYLVVERLWHMFTLIVKLEAPALAAWLKFWPVGLIGAGLILLIGRLWENRLGSSSPVPKGERHGR